MADNIYYDTLWDGGDAEERRAASERRFEAAARERKRASERDERYRREAKEKREREAAEFVAQLEAEKIEENKKRFAKIEADERHVWIINGGDPDDFPAYWNQKKIEIVANGGFNPDRAARAVSVRDL